MADYNFTGQQTKYNNIIPKMVSLWQEMLARKPLWDGMSVEKRVNIINAEKDPMVNLSWDVFKKLYINFYGDKYLELNDML